MLSGFSLANRTFPLVPWNLFSVRVMLRPHLWHKTNNVACAEYELSNAQLYSIVFQFGQKSPTNSGQRVVFVAALSV